ncbi:MAG: hypothetical protein AB7U82_33670 [Blastocatellales bacterium]
MQDNSAVWQSSLIGTVVGLCAHYAALIPALPGWLIQAVVTIAVGAISVVVNRLVARWMDGRKRGESQDSES